MDNYYERLNQAFANWNGGGEPSLEQRVENLETEIIQKQDILTFDSEPVEDSENPVTSGGLFSHFERYATKTALNEKVDISNFTADQDRQDALEAEDRAALVSLVDGGAKNVFKNTAVSKTYQGIIFTVNEDGTVSLSGTATSAVSVLEIGTVTPPAGSYIVSGCPAGGSWSQGTNKYRIRVAKNGAWVGDDIGNGRTITVNGSDTISLQINSGVGVDTAGLVFKPMLCTAADYKISPAFVPYRPSWQEMYDMIKALQSGS